MRIVDADVPIPMDPPTPLNSDFNEAALVEQAQRGSTVAFGELVRHYHGRVFGFLLTLARHRQDAEDLTQETFLQAWKKFNRFDPALPLLPWLLTLGRRQSITALRKSHPLPSILPFPAEPEPVISAPWLWEMARLKLKPDAYSALWLHYAEEMPVREVAAILGKREVAVKVLLHRARKNLAETLRKKPSEAAPTFTSP